MIDEMYPSIMRQRGAKCQCLVDDFVLIPKEGIRGLLCLRHSLDAKNARNPIANFTATSDIFYPERIYVLERPTMASRRIKLAWVLGGSLAILGILLVLAAWSVTQRWSAFRKEVDAELVLVRDAKQPVCWEDLSWFYPSPAPDKDMTKPILDALAMLPTAVDKSRIRELVDNWDEFGSPDKWPINSGRGVQPADVERYLRENRRCIDGLLEAVMKGGEARYPIEQELVGGHRVGKRVGNLLTVAVLLRLNANECAERGDALQATRSLRTILGLSQSLEREPYVLTFCVRKTIEIEGCMAIADCIPRIQLPTADLIDLDKALSHANEQEEFAAALSVERLIAIMLLHEGLRNPSAGNIFARASAQELQHDFAQYLRYMSEAIDCVRHPWPQSLHKAQQLSDRWDKITSRESLAITTMSKLALPEMIKRSEHDIAIKNAARVVIAAERYRQDHQVLPDRLDALTPHYLPELPQDPFTGEPLQWLVDDQGVVVYSLGPNGSDDHTRGDDIVVRVKYSDLQRGGKSSAKTE